MNLHSGSIEYEIKKGYIHVYARDEFFNTVEIVLTKEQFNLLYKIITRKWNMKVSQRRKLQKHFWKLVEHTEVDRMKGMRNKGIDKSFYIESQALEDATKETIKMILGESYYYKFFYNEAIDIRNKTFNKMLEKFNQYDRS